MSQETRVLYSKQREPSCDLEERESCSVQKAVIQPPGPQHVSAARVTHLPRAQEATCPKQEGATGECAESEDAENELRSSTGRVKKPLKCQNGSEAENIQKKPLQFLCERFRSHPKVTLVLTLLVMLVLALVPALAVLSGGRQTNIAAFPGTPLACPDDWVGYRRICYFLSKDQHTWDQGQARCSELGASLAVLRDEEMEFLSRPSRKVNLWLGLRRRGQQLQWEDGSSFNSSVPVLGDAECVFLAENKLRSVPCSYLMPYLCSRAQTRL